MCAKNSRPSRDSISSRRSSARRAPARRRRDEQRDPERRQTNGTAFVELSDQRSRARHQIPFWWRDDDADGCDACARQVARACRGGTICRLRSPSSRSERRQRSPSALASEPNVVGAPARLAASKPRAERRKAGGAWRSSPARRGPRRARARLRPADASSSRTQFLPVLVPPWNRIARCRARAARQDGWPHRPVDVRARAAERPALGQRASRYFRMAAGAPPAQARARLMPSSQRSWSGGSPAIREPIGIMTHHLVHEEASWAFLEDLFGLIAKHPAVAWPPHSGPVRTLARRGLSA